MRTRLWLRAAILAAMLSCAHAGADDTGVSSTAVLRAKFGDLAPQFENNAFRRPLVLESSETGGSLKGSVYALPNHPYATFADAMKDPRHWCDILILHLNTKYCRAVPALPGTVLQVGIGRKSDQTPEQSHRVDFAFRIVEANADHLAIVLDADKGPFGTRNCRILLEAVPGRDGRTDMHLAYSYSYGAATRLGLMAYLGTTGSRKVGFTVTGQGGDGQPIYIDGLRGLVERNTMRYYLAIEAYLGALAVPPAAQLDRRLNDWYASAEKYPRQLHEIGQREYLEMKHREVERSRLPF